MIKYLIIAITLSVSVNLKAQEEASKVDLLVENFDEFEIFGDQLDDYKVYFTGENHLYPTFNTHFQFKLLKYLHQNQGR